MRHVLSSLIVGAVFTLQASAATVDGLKIHSSSAGTARETIILVHGWTCDSTSWTAQVAPLSKTYRVVTLDLPGHGLSGSPADGKFSVSLFARAVEAVRAEANAEKVVLVGHSMGAPVVRQFYRKYPQKTLALVIVDGGLRPFGTKEARERLMTPLRGPEYKDFGVKMFAGMTPTLPQADKDRITQSFLNTPQHVIVSAMDAMADETLYGTDKINVPVLAILAKSPFWAPDTEEFYRSLAPDLDFQMWEGVDHFLFMGKPKEFNAAVINFLDKKKLLK